MKQITIFISRRTGFLLKEFSKISIALFGFVLFAIISCGISDDITTQSDLEQAQTTFEQLMESPGNVTILFPEDDPGIPIYARVGPILNQFFVADGQLIIPFYRDPECIRDDFDFLTYYDPPAAFGCELTVNGKFVIEEDAEQGTFPIMAHTEGNQVPVWIIDWPGFQALMERESVAITDLEALNPIKAVAHQYEEYLSPRMNEHEVIIEATGTVQATGEAFTFSLTHRGDQIESITLNID
jgi:hypothetical protein